MKKDVKKVFGEKVREVRKNKGFSQEELATIAGLHRTYISDIERGNKNISLENIYKIARALTVDVYLLFKQND